MEIIYRQSPFLKTKADVALVFVINGNLAHAWVKSQEELRRIGFIGKHAESIFIPQENTLYYALDSLDADTLREASAKALRILKKYPFATLKVGSYIGEESLCIEAMIAGFLLGDYTFATYKSKGEEEIPALKQIIISSESYDEKSIDTQTFNAILARQKSITDAVNMTRELVNTPPDDATPKKLAEVARNLAKEHNLACIIKKKKEIKEENMGAFLAVSRASVHPPRLIHLTHKSKKPALRIALVGKGLTYDSGGLSLKPSDYMVTMKADKGGGCAVLGIMKAASELNLNLEIHGIIGATENMIGGDAYKPDDILKAKNGKRIEIRNTDAEGRLVLADCLCYAQELKPDYIIDLATLTGACVVGLGEYTSGILGYNSALKHRFLQCAQKSGELAAELPFNRHLKELIKSKIADVCNVSSTRYGGSITAGLFLSEFIEESYKDKWLHLDIAGPAYVEKEWDVNPYGASGAGVRMVIEFLEQLTKES